MNYSLTYLSESFTNDDIVSNLLFFLLLQGSKCFFFLSQESDVGQEGVNFFCFFLKQPMVKKRLRN